MSLETEAPRLLLGRYRLTDPLASGGSAEVWRAHDEQLDRWVAVKLLHHHLLPDARSRQRLAAEARAAAGLRHPGIVAVYDVDVEGEAAALVMQLIDGESLAVRLARGPLAPRLAVGIAADVADALLHAHERGIVHRDVKPGNILLDANGRAHLADFGIAHSLAESSMRLTLTGTVMGTLRYMAPEQLADGPIGPKTDVYALGVVLFEMLAGHVPFAASSPVGLAEAQRAGPPPLPEVDPTLAPIARSCLAFEPSDRARHAGVVADALRAWLVTGSSALPSEAITQAAVIPAPIPAPVPRASRRRRRLAPWMVAVAGALLIGLLGFAVLTGGFSAQPAVIPDSSPTPTISASPSPTVSAKPAPTAKPSKGDKGKGHGG